MWSVHWSCWSPPGVPSARYGSPSRSDQRRRQRRARPLARVRASSAVLPRARTSARASRGRTELRYDRRPPQPAAARRRRDHVAEAVDDIEVHGVALRPGAVGSPTPAASASSALLSTRARRGVRPSGEPGWSSPRRLVADQLAALVRVLAGEQFLHRDSAKRVAVPRLAVCERELRALGEACDVRPRCVSSSGEVEAFEQPQLLEEDGRLAPRAGLSARSARGSRPPAAPRSGGASREGPPPPAAPGAVAGAVQPRMLQKPVIASATKPRYQTSCAASICSSRSVERASASSSTRR